jgi:hypothetical protein
MIPDNRPTLSDQNIWDFVAAGCNVNEIAAYACVSIPTAYAMMGYATRAHAHPVAATVVLSRSNQT